MSNFKKAIGFGLVGWLTLAIFSVLQYPKILAQSCYFGQGWLFCPSQLGALQKFVLISLLFVVFSCLVCSGVFLWKMFKNGEKPKSKKQIIGVVAFFVFLAALVVPFGSGDVVFYFWAGKSISSGTVNVFTQDWPRENHFVQPTFKVMDRFPYGPITARAFGVVYDLSRDNVIAFIILWKLISVAFFSLCGWLVYKFLDLSEENSQKSNFWLLWFLQPAALFEWVGHGHFDSIWLVFIMLALILAKRKTWWLVLPCLVVGIWIKFIPVFFIPWFILRWWQEVDRQNWKKMLGGQVVGVAISAAITVLVWAKFWQGFAVFEIIAKLSKWAVNSTFAVIYYSLEPLFKSVAGANFHWYLTRFVHLGLLGLILYLMYPFVKKAIMVIFKKDTLGESDFLSAVLVSMVVYIVFWQKAIWPWYMVWLLPLGIMAHIKSRNECMRRVVAWITLSPLFFYFVWMFHYQVTDGGDATINLWFYYFVVLSVFAYPAYNLFKLRKTGFGIAHPAVAGNLFVFILRQIYRVVIVFPYLLVVSVIEWFVKIFSRRSVKKDGGGDVCFIISSVIYPAASKLSYGTRSVYSPEERAAQTLSTVVSIKEKVPNAKIVLVESGLQENLPLDLAKQVDQYLYLGNKFFVRRTCDSRLKSLGEAVMLLCAIKHIKFNAEVFFKISGRYSLDENFDFSTWKTDLFKFFYIRKDYVSTRLYSFGKSMLRQWQFALIKGLPLLLLDYPIEHILARFVPKKYIQTIDKVGVMGADATNGVIVKE